MNYDEAKAQVFEHVTPQVGEVRRLQSKPGENHRVRVESFDDEWVTLKTIDLHPLVRYQHNLREWCDNVADGLYTKA